MTNDKVDMIDKEISKELGKQTGISEEVLPKGESLQFSRKPFRIADFDTPKDREMAVFTHAKKLSEYLFIITEKSPVKYRWNIVSRLLNTSVEIIEALYRANYEQGEERLVWQKKAMVQLDILDFYAITAKDKQAINFHQMTVIAAQLTEVKKLLSGWVRSTKQKKGKESGQ